MGELLTEPRIQMLILIIAIVTLFVQLITKTKGIAGIISLGAFILFFYSNYVLEEGSVLSILLFVVGILLLILEVIVPGFGLPGVVGFISLLFGTVMVMESNVHAFTSLGIAFVLSFVIASLVFKRGLENDRLKKLVLTTGEKRTTSSKKELIGKNGWTITPLRPSGMVEIEGERMDCVTEGEFLPSKVEVEVIKVEGFRIVVKKVS